MTMTREDLLREVMREYAPDDTWVGGLCDDLPGEHKRWLLVEHNTYPLPPAWLSTHDSPREASDYYISQEYREDWIPKRLLDLDTGAMHDIGIAIALVFDPPVESEIVSTVPHPVRAERRPCKKCRRPIQPDQLYLVESPFHIGCAPR